MNYYNVILSAALKEPFEIISDIEKKEGSATGFVLTLNLKASDSMEAFSFSNEATFKATTSDGTPVDVAFIEQVELKKVELEEFDDEMKQDAINMSDKGVFFTSGLAFFIHEKEKKSFWNRLFNKEN